MRGFRPIAVFTATVALLSTAACAPGALDSSDPTEPSSSAPTETSATATPTSDPVESTTPPTVEPVFNALELSCEQVLTAQQVYDINPNFAATSAPRSTVPAEVQAVADADGVLCAWEHTTTGDPLFAAVALTANAPDAASIDAASGILYIKGSVSGAYWIAVASPYFSASDPLASDTLALIAGQLPVPDEQ